MFRLTPAVRHFAYGGSTIVVVFPKGLVECVILIFFGSYPFLCSMSSISGRFDEDLVSNSQHPIETLLKVRWNLILVYLC
jgi:hypothetical protein